MLRGLGVLVHPSLRNVGLKAAQRAWAVCRSWREPQAAPGEAGRFGGGAGAASRALAPAKATQGFCFAL